MSAISVQSNFGFAAGPGLECAFSSPNTAGNSIVVIAFTSNGTTTGISDTQGNSYTQVAQQESSSGWAEPLYVTVWLAQNIRAGANTVTVDTSYAQALAILEYPLTFVGADPYDGGNISAALDSGTFSIGLGSETTQADDLVIAYGYSGAGLQITFTAGSGFTMEGQVYNTNARNFFVEDMLLKSQSTPTASVGLSQSATGYIAVVALKVDPPVILTESLPNAEYNQPYSETLSAVSGVTPYTWSITEGSLPNGLSLNASTGVISGIPTVLGTFAFTVQLADSASPPNVETAPLSIVVAINAPIAGGWDEYQRVLLQRRF